jgi:hypothetical protein
VMGMSALDPVGSDATDVAVASAVVVPSETERRSDTIEVSGPRSPPLLSPVTVDPVRDVGTIVIETSVVDDEEGDEEEVISSNELGPVSAAFDEEDGGGTITEDELDSVSVGSGEGITEEKRDERSGVPGSGSELGPVSRGSDDFPGRVSTDSEDGEEGEGVGEGVSDMAPDSVSTASVEDGPEDPEDTLGPVSMGPVGIEGDDEGSKGSEGETNKELGPVSVAWGSVPVLVSLLDEGSEEVVVVASSTMLKKCTPYHENWNFSPTSVGRTPSSVDVLPGALDVPVMVSSLVVDTSGIGSSDESKSSKPPVVDVVAECDSDWAGSGVSLVVMISGKEVLTNGSAPSCLLTCRGK